MTGWIRKLVLTDDGSTKPSGVAIAALVLVVSATALGYYVWKADWGGGVPQIEAPTQCWECGYTESRKAVVGEPPVLHCPKCGKQAFAPAVACTKCRTLVVLNEYRGVKPPTKCPKCGGEVRHGD